VLDLGEKLDDAWKAEAYWALHS